MSRKAFFVLKELPWNAATWHSWNVRVRTNFMFACTYQFLKKKLLLLDISRCMLDKLKTLKVLSFAKKSSVIDFSCCSLEAWKQTKRDNLFHCCITSIWFLFYTVFWQMELFEKWKRFDAEKYTYNVVTGWLGRPIQGLCGCLESFPFGRYCLVPLYTLCKVTLSK